jgi:SDR family mycofactocin-dependent oxidoreductase
VCLITGAARGQGRSHALRLAAEGAAIVAFDLSERPTEIGYPAATKADLDETVALVEAAGGRIVARRGDVRSRADLDAAVADALEHFGRIDVVVANAGVSAWGRIWEIDDEVFQAVVDINLTGVWRTFAAAIPAMIEQGDGGSLIAISSSCGLKAQPGQAHYSSSKHGVVGLVKSAAIELGPHRIRVNSIHPGGVDTPMGHNPDLTALLETNPEYGVAFGQALPEPYLAPVDDISTAVCYLASDASRYVTGIQLPIDMGAVIV